MGGRGGASGLSNIISRIPREEDFKPVRPAQLQGSEKQIEWAKKIRLPILKQLALYATMNMSDGRPSGLYDIAKQGTNAIKNYIENSHDVKGTSGKKREKIFQKN